MAGRSNVVKAIDHISVAVVDLEQAIRWYEQNLGFHLVERRTTEGEATSMCSAVMKSGTATVVLIQGTTPDSQVSKFIEAYGPGVQHLAFEVTNLEAALAEFGSAKAEFEPIEGEGIRQVFLHRDAASGVRIELIERNGGTFNDQSVTKLFRAFEKKDLF